MKIDKKILCLMHKYQFGDSKKPISAEYNGIYKSLKKINDQTYFLDTHNRKKTIYENNLEILKKVKKIKPDIIFCHQSSYEIYKETLVILKKICDPILINWCSDDSWRFDQHSILIAKSYDYMITTYSYSHKKYLRLKVKSILASWGCPDHWINKTKTEKNYLHDVTFIGNPYMGRKKIINKLSRDGIHVNCYGPGWKSVISDKNIQKVIKRSKICLNFSKSKGNKKQTKARIFEITGLESLCITEISSELKNYFRVDKELVSFKDYNELLKKIKFFLKNEKLRKKISKQGYLRCKKNYTYTKIMKEILSKTKLNKKKKSIKMYNYLLPKPKYNFCLKLYKIIFVSILNIFFTTQRSISLSRRILFELEWRLHKHNTYSVKGWCNRIFDFN